MHKKTNRGNIWIVELRGYSFLKKKIPSFTNEQHYSERQGKNLL